jgi:uncharacterized protein (TIGR00730 family)
VSHARALHRVCVYCGSSAGRLPAYTEAARELGTLLAARDIELVYGGGSVGLMGEVATAALAAGGRVIGVIPEKLQALELGKADLTELRIVPDMHTRKRTMADLADAFIALPGGYGTMEELFEAVTWTQLAYHSKPVGLLDVADYFQPLLRFVRHMVDEGFVRELHAPLIQHDVTAAGLLDRLEQVRLPSLESWIDDV